MKRMSKLISLCLALLCVLSVAIGCEYIPEDLLGENTTAGTTTGGTTSGTTAATTTAVTTGKPIDPALELITIAKALELCGEPGNVTTERYYIRAEVVSISNPTYGGMTIKDETGSIAVYGTYSEDGEKLFADLENKPKKGDYVILHCILQNYNGTKEVKNARLIEVIAGQFDESNYKAATVAEARNADEGAKLKVSGVVARITYANGQVPAGVILVDNTQSIYLYDSSLAGAVKIGDKVTVAGTKAYWVLDTEQSNADKFGYKGCCQLDDVHLLSHEKGENDYDKSWIPTTTIKEILETPVTENVTSSIFKVTALVKKAPGTGFTNYYFYDLDGTTGTYTYTQCNGKDFAWLDAFDGKICTVYITPLNAKSTATSCLFRFLPISVVDEGFTFDTANTPEHVVEYYGLPQFAASYTGDPALELVTSVSSALLNFENATLTYASDNTEVVYFTTEGGKTTFHCGKTGSAKITVTGSHGGKTFSATTTVTVTENKEYDTITVEAAIGTAVDEIVTIRGIVGPSVVNKNGFYLFDETGMIAVVVKNVETFQEIQIGHEIVITGRREDYKKDTTTYAGQISIVDAEVLANYYGEHAYPTDKFITDKTLADFYALDAMEHHTTEVYLVKATIEVVETNYYTSIAIKDGDTKVSLYCASANQYSFLKAYAGQEVTLELAPCNWNDKKFYVGCVLALHAPDGTVIYNTLNFNN